MPPRTNTRRVRSGSSQNLAGAGPRAHTGPYEKLINRMYEPLKLLHALDPVRGGHTASATLPSPITTQHIRRQFRDDLAFLCEHDKGGDACTALGIEEREDCLVYWVAANTNPQNKIVPFLADLMRRLVAVLKDVHAAVSSGNSSTALLETASKEITAYCTAYALSKIKKICALLRKAIDNCTTSLAGGTFSGQEKALAGWLQRVSQSTDALGAVGAGLDLCRLAYDKRKSAEMQTLKALAQMQQDQPHSAQSPLQCFSKAYHYIGRLANHIRVPARLVGSVMDVEDLLLNPFHIQALPVVDSAPYRPLPRPSGAGPATHRSLLESIAVRMCRSDDTELLAELTAGLQELEQKHQLTQRMQLDDKSFKAPRVHAEVQVLEHFHAQRLVWADNGDRYIGCSKAACYCCHLYFRHHPLRPVVPDCHNKVYLKWGPPLLVGGVAHPGFKEQQTLLNRFIEDVRKDAIEQIRERRGRRPFWQPDSATAITQTVAGDNVDDGDRDNDGDDEDVGGGLLNSRFEDGVLHESSNSGDGTISAVSEKTYMSVDVMIRSLVSLDLNSDR
ncbi:hypothetical protein HMPREF1624_06023 [Sporothrix schenckii ATCC 58251]|uniref:Uncharacterized protein n=1 Tax=Sporothrix schenckii (strain ATCC 58251 / de Perez 2211183) TaxID=1391915 RepID=U7PQH6_SPOS1|nr:hypothetical protein HMPREF1624_06023 [Sporothrix schenckii ATCC 58251]